MDIIQIFATIFSVIGAICLVWGGSVKDVHKSHVIQVIDCSAHTIVTILLLSWPGALANFTALIREIIAAKGRMTRIKQISICSIMVITGILLNNRGVVGLFPLIGSAIYILIGCSPSAGLVSLKSTYAANMFLWSIHDFVIGAYPTALADILTVASCVWAIIYFYKTKRKTSEL